MIKWNQDTKDDGNLPGVFLPTPNKHLSHQDCHCCTRVKGGSFFWLCALFSPSTHQQHLPFKKDQAAHQNGMKTFKLRLKNPPPVSTSGGDTSAAASHSLSVQLACCELRHFVGQNYWTSWPITVRRMVLRLFYCLLPYRKWKHLYYLACLIFK